MLTNGPANNSQNKHDEINLRLKNIVGDRFASDNLAETAIYGWDFVTCSTEPGWCEFVVMPAKTEEIADIVTVARKYRLPVIPIVSGMNFGGLGIPRQGGIVLDLRRMNRIIEVNEDDMYAVVEGGITWGDLQGYLQTHHPGLRAGLTYSPPSTGVLASYLEHGMLDLSMIAGTGSNFLNGLEVVLGSGRIIRTGTAMFSKYWYDRAPTPDISGLLIGWSGTSGIVTKGSIRLWPNWVTNPWSITADTFRQGIEIEKALFKSGLSLVDTTAVNHSWAMMMKNFKAGDTDKVPFRAEQAGLPDYFGTVKLFGCTEKEMAAKAEALEEIVTRLGGGLRYGPEAFDAVPQNERGTAPLSALELPLQAVGTWNFSGGGGEWCGAYLPVNLIADYYERARDIAIKYSKHGLYYHRAMSFGHSHVGRLNVEFDKSDTDDVEKSKECLMKIDSLAKEMGVIRYKAPHWAARREVEQGHLQTMEFLKELKSTMDPDGIMNPGQGYV